MKTLARCEVCLPSAVGSRHIFQLPKIVFFSVGLATFRYWLIKNVCNFAFKFASLAFKVIRLSTGAEEKLQALKPRTTSGRLEASLPEHRIHLFAQLYTPVDGV